MKLTVVTLTEKTTNMVQSLEMMLTKVKDNIDLKANSDHIFCVFEEIEQDIGYAKSKVQEQCTQTNNQPNYISEYKKLQERLTDDQDMDLRKEQEKLFLSWVCDNNPILIVF
jgi:hypothetical protein